MRLYTRLAKISYIMGILFDLSSTTYSDSKFSYFDTRLGSFARHLRARPERMFDDPWSYPAVEIDLSQTGMAEASSVGIRKRLNEALGKYEATRAIKSCGLTRDSTIMSRVMLRL